MILFYIKMAHELCSTKICYDYSCNWNYRQVKLFFVFVYLFTYLLGVGRWALMAAVGTTEMDIRFLWLVEHSLSVWSSAPSYIVSTNVYTMILLYSF